MIRTQPLSVPKIFLLYLSLTQDSQSESGESVNFIEKTSTIDLVDELDFYEQENDENTEIENTEIEKKLKKKAKIKNKLVKKVKKEVIEDEDDDKEHQCYR